MTGGALAGSQLPPLCPSLWLPQKELSVLLQHSGPREGTLWLGEESAEGGWSLLPLSLSCLGSLLALNLLRLLAAEPKIFARTGQEWGEEAVCPKPWACLQENRVGAERKGVLRGAAELSRDPSRQKHRAGYFLKTTHLIRIFLNFISCLNVQNVQKLSGLFSFASATAPSSRPGQALFLPLGLQSITLTLVQPHLWPWSFCLSSISQSRPTKDSQ